MTDVLPRGDSRPARVVGVGASAGRVDALLRLVSALPAHAVGKPFRELELSFRLAELRRPVDEALRRVPVGEVAFRPETGDERRLEVR